MRNRYRACLLALLILACGRGPNVEPAAVVVLFRSAASAQQQQYRIDAARVFGQWIVSATPGSRFDILVAGTTRSDGDVAFSVSVPTRWGGNALAQKAKFLTDARQAFDAACATGFASRDALIVDDSLPIAKLVILPDNGPMTPTRNGGPLHCAVVCDRSASGVGLACTIKALEYAFDRWVATGGTTEGSTFMVITAGTDLSTARRVFSLVIPHGKNVASRFEIVLGARNELQAAVTPPPQGFGSDVAGAILVASRALRERVGRYQLVVCSDLRELAPGIEQEAVASPERFVTQLRQGRLLANLWGIELTICGVHTRDYPGGPHVTSRGDGARRDAWTAAFKAMGVASVHMCEICDQIALN